MTGSVKWWNVAKGFGFVTLTDGRDVFCHWMAIRGEGKDLAEGQLVHCQLECNSYGEWAVKVASRLRDASDLAADRARDALIGDVLAALA